MQKRIIAVACAVIIIATLFVSCKKDMGYKLGKDELGFEHAYVTDAEGNTVLDENGNILVYQTDKNGEIATDENGEQKQNFINMPTNAIIEDDTVEIKLFKYNVPKGFKANQLGWLMKSGTEDKCYINVVYAATLDEDTTLEEYIDELTFKNTALIKAINDGEYIDDGFKTAENTREPINIANGKAKAICDTYKFLSAEDKVVHYASATYFTLGSDVYVASYCCIDGVGYDESFDFVSWLQNDLIIK